MNRPDLEPQSFSRAEAALDALLDLGRLAASLADADEVLAALARAAVYRLGANAAAVLRLEPNAIATVVACENEDLGDWRGEVETIDQTLGERLHDAATRRYEQVLTLPLAADADLVGALVLFFLRSGTLDVRSVGVAQGMADLAASAIVKALRYAELERLTGNLKSAQARLHATVERLRSLIDTAGSAILFLSPEGRILEFNREAERIYGYSREEVLGTRYPERLLPEAARAGVLDELSRVLDGGTSRGFENEITTKNGERRVLLWNADRLLDRDGQPVGVVAVGQDVTGRKLLEAELLHAQKMEALGRLAGGIAHDFNNVLMGITGCAEVALSKLADSNPARRYVDEIKEAGMRGASLTRQLKTFGRRRPIEPRVLDINELVRQSQPLMAPIVPERITLSLELEAGDARVLGDAGQVEQALMNLIINACDAMPKGGKLSIATCERVLHQPRGERPAGRYLCLSVSDNGMGMDERTKRRLFEPFFTTKGTGEGTGLGLAMVYSTVQQMGGLIEVDSAPARGSTFRLLLPLSERPLAMAAPSSPESTREGRGEVVMLVEDDQLVRMSIRHWLEDAGYRVLTSGDGAEAIRILEERSPHVDALLSDVRLPGALGGEVGARARELNPSIAVLYLSGHSDVDDQRLDPAPLAKPFTRSELMTRLRAALSHGPERASRPARAPRERASTVLVIDDHEATRRAVRLLLEDRYRVLDAATAEHAIELAGAPGAAVDLIVTDISLPDMTAPSLVRELRRSSPEAQVIFVSGHSESDAVVQEALQLPRSCFLAKPIDVDLLEGRIEELLDSH